jgi:transposase
MAVVCPPGAGLDVPTQTVMACRVVPEPLGPPAAGRLEVQACGTLTRDWLAVCDGLTEAGSTPVALESTGDDGTPGSTLLEGPWTVWLVKAAPVTNGPGRTTDRADARGLAQRMR